MVLFPALIIYSIVKKYVAIYSKENTANILISIIFLHIQSHFIVFDFTIKSLPIIVFYFRCRMLDDSLTFKLSSLPPWKKKEENENVNSRTKERSANVKTRIGEKNCDPFYL